MKIVIFDDGKGGFIPALFRICDNAQLYRSIYSYPDRHVAFLAAQAVAKSDHGYDVTVH